MGRTTWLVQGAFGVVVLLLGASLGSEVLWELRRTAEWGLFEGAARVLPWAGNRSHADGLRPTPAEAPPQGSPPSPPPLPPPAPSASPRPALPSPANLSPANLSLANLSTARQRLAAQRGARVAQMLDVAKGGDRPDENASVVAPDSGNRYAAPTHLRQLMAKATSGDLRWVDWVASNNSLPMTVEMQAVLFLHQNPATCHDRRFLVWKMFNSGLGNDLHILSWALAAAINLGRILAIDTVTIMGNDWKYARGLTPNTPEYYFLPITNCSLAEIRRTKPIGGLHFPGQTARFKFGAELPRGFERYGATWWRAQASRYFLRSQPHWQAHLRRFHANLSSLIPDPLPPNVISIHVRHSDKKKEMDLLPLSAYMAYADKLRSIRPELTAIFLSSEDGVVIRAAERFPTWTFYSVPEPRQNLNHEGFVARFGGRRLMEISLLNLHFHAQADAFIGTRMSNWCRLIDEVRLTGGKMDRPMVWLNGAASTGNI